MQVELNNDDLEVLEQALVAYERGDGGLGRLISKMLVDGMCPPEHRARQEQQAKEHQAKEEQASRTRRIQASIVRTKLFQAQSLSCLPS